MAQKFVLLLVATFPLATVTVEGGSSIVYTLLALAGVVSGWSEWKHLSKAERLFVGGYGVLFLYAVLTLSYTEDFGEGVKDADRFLRVATLGPIYLMLRHLRLHTGPVVLAALVGTSLIMAGQGLYETEILNRTVANGAYHKIVFGDTAALVSALLVVGLVSVFNRGLPMLVLSLAASAGLYASLVSATRGAWLFLLVFAAFTYWVFRHRCGVRHLVAALAVTVITGAVLGLAQPSLVYKPVEKGIESLEAYFETPETIPRSSWGVRLFLWKTSFLAWQKTPLFGAGLGSYQNAMRDVIQAEKTEPARFQELLDGVKRETHILRWLNNQTRDSGKLKALRKHELKQRRAEIREHQDIRRGYLSELNQYWPGWRHVEQFSHAHSIYFDQLVRLGAIGLLLTVAALFVLPYRLFNSHWRRAQDPWHRFYALAGMVTVLAYAVFGLSEGWLLRNALVTLYVVFIAAFAAGLALPAGEQTPGPPTASNSA